jgi:tetratricopeptide (TPR) repeat protein
MRTLAFLVLGIAAVALGAIQAVAAIALRESGRPGSWPGLVPPAVAERVDRTPAWMPLPPALRLVLARGALARGDLPLAVADTRVLPPSADRTALEGGIADAGGDAAAAVSAYLAAGDLAGVERHVDAFVRDGRIAAALALERAAVARLEQDRTQADALAQAFYHVGVLEQARAYELPSSAAERAAHESASAVAYGRALDLAPLDVRYLIAFANQQLNRSELPAAAAAFERARDVDPTSAEPLTGLGEIALRRGDQTTARADLARARALAPASAAVRRLARKLGG